MALPEHKMTGLGLPQPQKTGMALGLTEGSIYGVRALAATGFCYSIPKNFLGAVSLGFRV